MFPDDDLMPVTVRASLFSFLAASGGHQSKGWSPVGHITSTSSRLAIPGTDTLRGQGQTLNNIAFFSRHFQISWGYPGLWSSTKKSLYLCSSGSNSQGEWWALEGHHVSSKSPSRVQNEDEVVAWRNGREKYLNDEGALSCPPGHIVAYLASQVFDFLWSPCIKDIFK